MEAARLYQLPPFLYQRENDVGEKHMSDRIIAGGPQGDAAVAQIPPEEKPIQIKSIALPSAADVSCTTGDDGALTCSIDDDGLKAVRDRTRSRLAASIRTGYEHFPADRKWIFGSLLNGMLTQDTILTAVTSSNFAKRENHNELRNKHKGESMTPREALPLGVIAKRFKLERACPEHYDWETSPVFNTIDSCDDVWIELDRGGGMPATMFAVDLPAASAQTYLDRLEAAPLYTYYVSPPVRCGEGTDEKGRNFVDAYHHIYVFKPFGIKMDFIMRGFTGNGWSAWTLRSECVDVEGRARESAELMFNFGTRVYIPVRVSVDGAMHEQTLVMDSIAAASNSAWRRVIGKNTPYHRFICGGFRKKILLEAHAKGWEIKR